MATSQEFDRHPIDHGRSWKTSGGALPFVPEFAKDNVLHSSYQPHDDSLGIAFLWNGNLFRVVS